MTPQQPRMDMTATNAKALLWAHKLHREYGYLLQRLESVEGMVAATIAYSKISSDIADNALKSIRKVELVATATTQGLIKIDTRLNDFEDSVQRLSEEQASLNAKLGLKADAVTTSSRIEELEQFADKTDRQVFAAENRIENVAADAAETEQRQQVLLARILQSESNLGSLTESFAALYARQDALKDSVTNTNTLEQRLRKLEGAVTKIQEATDEKSQSRVPETQLDAHVQASLVVKLKAGQKLRRLQTRLAGGNTIEERPIEASMIEKYKPIRVPLLPPMKKKRHRERNFELPVLVVQKRRRTRGAVDGGDGRLLSPSQMALEDRQQRIAYPPVKTVETKTLRRNPRRATTRQK